jgi:RNase P subunit RPR2
MDSFGYNSLQYFLLLQNYAYQTGVPQVICETWDNEAQIQQIAVVSSQKESKCEECEKVFKTEANLKNHQKTVHERVFRVTCAKCGQAFANKYILRKHAIKQHPPKAEIN